MESRQNCTRHRTAEARFVCDQCHKPFCAECRCELLDSSVCCTECAVETAGEHGGVFAARHGDGYPDVDQSKIRAGSRRFLTVFLLVCISLLAVEGLFLHRSTAKSAGAVAEERHVMSDTLVLITVLNRYKSEVGRYPERLEEIVPAHWMKQDMAELERYEYRRIGTERFVLRPRLTGKPDDDAGIVRALSLIPRSFGQDSSLDVFLRNGTSAAGTPAKGGRQ